jgi:hypothetical protein
LPPNVTSMFGSFIGSFVGLIALLLGALFNAYLARRRDDRIRKHDAKALISAIKAELQYFKKAFGIGSEALQNNKNDQSSNYVLAHDISKSVRVLPVVITNIGLLESETVAEVLRAYAIIDDYDNV